MAVKASKTSRRRRGRPHLLADRSVRTKILLVLAVAMTAAAAVGWSGLRAVAETNASTELLYRQSVARTQLATKIRFNVVRGLNDMQVFAMAPDDASADRGLDAVLAADDELDRAMEEYADLGLAGKRDAGFSSVTTALRAYRAVRAEKLFPLAKAHQIAEYQQVYGQTAAPLVAVVVTTVDDLVAIEEAEAAVAFERAQETYRSGQNSVHAFLLAGLLLAGALGLWVARLIIRPLRTVADVLDAVADGDLTRCVTVSSRDEVGRMAEALNRATGAMREAVQTMAESACSMATAAEELANTSAEISAGAEETSVQASAVAEAADQVSRNVFEAASGADEMDASIREIALNAVQAATIAGEAVSAADDTNLAVARLGESSKEIGNVVKLITSIAEQTNLLALNATIEAARAGEYGRGFAVVATEVKDLAQESARATDDIAQRVSAIQADTASAVAAIEVIARIIGQINEYQTTIASAVEEQSATTKEINRSVNHAAAGASEIAQNVSGVAAAAQQTTAGVVNAQTASRELSQMSSTLQTLVTRFRV